MPNIQFKVVYNYERTSTLRQDGTAAVYIRAYLNGKNSYFNTGISITPKQWHKRNRTVVHHPNQYQLNKQIRDEIEKMQRFEYELRETSQEVSLKRLKDYREHKSIRSFTDFIKDQLEREKARLTHSTFTDQRQTLQKLEAFKDNIRFHEIKPKLLKSFVEFLHTQGLSQNTVHKHYKNFRKFINLAIKYEYLSPDKNPCKHISVKKEKTDPLFLLEHEFKLFERFEIPEDKQHLEKVKDMFLFTCMTGLRFSDVSRLTRENIIETPEGMYLHIRAQKSRKAYRQNLRKLFPLPGMTYSRPEQIIKRRIESLLFPDDVLFVYRSRGPYVKQLKKMAKMINVREKVKSEISSHTGRHTFGTIMAGKVGVHVLKELMQHSNIRETMIYVHLNKKMIDNALDRVIW
jgi:integrase